MGYLVCDKCKGYYELKNGESPEDFNDTCECGGNYEYVENVETTGEDFVASVMIACPKCGAENPEDAKLCKSCHKVLNFSHRPSVDVSNASRNSYENHSSRGGLYDAWGNKSSGIKIFSLLGVCLLGLLLIGGAMAVVAPDTFESLTSPSSSSKVSTTNVTGGSSTSGSGGLFVDSIIIKEESPMGDSKVYSFSANLRSSKNFDYLQMATKWYDAGGNVLNRDPITWNTNNAKANENYKISSTQYLPGKPVRVEIMVFDTPAPSDDSKAIYRIWKPVG